MSTQPCIFERRFRNQLQDLGRVMDEGIQFLEEHATAPHPAYVANLAIEELATNIIKYGYDDTAPHEILLRLEIQPRMLLLRIEDDGHEFNPLAVAEPDVTLPTEEREPGGLGIHLVRKMVDEIHYQRCAGRNQVMVKIRIPTQPH
jgi:serine/threonine-protein kinase RsbW